MVQHLTSGFVVDYQLNPPSICVPKTLFIPLSRINKPSLCTALKRCYVSLKEENNILSVTLIFHWHSFNYKTLLCPFLLYNV